MKNLIYSIAAVVTVILIALVVVGTLHTVAPQTASINMGF